MQGARVGPEGARRIAEACARVLQERFGARAVYVIGSAAGESPWHSRSDLDLVVEGLPSDRYLEALSTLWDLLPEGLDLDLIPLEEAPTLLQQLPASPTFIETAAAGKLVHDFYTGVERIFERIAVRLGPGLPAGPKRLVDYLRFRHLFRQGYGYELQWEKLEPLVRSLPETLEEFRRQLARFLEALERA